MSRFTMVAGLLGLGSAALLSGCAVPTGTAEETSTTSDELSPTLTTGLTAAATASFSSSYHEVLHDFGTTQGWNKQDVRLFGDVDGDGDQDLVAIDDTGVYFARYQAPKSALFAPTLGPKEFVQNLLRTDAYGPVMLGRLDYDNKVDILKFGYDGAYVVYTGYDSNYRFEPVHVSTEFGANHNWGPSYPRMLGDVTGDGFDDIVGFGDAGVWVANSLPAICAYDTAQLKLAEFGLNQGWRVDRHLRFLADVNNDGKKDIVGFKDDGVWLSLATATGFGPAKRVLNAFGYGSAAGGWLVDTNPRMLADVNADNKADIVGFGNDGIYVSLSTGNGFGPATRWSTEFGANLGWSEPYFPRFVADRNGDHRADIIGFGRAGMYVASSTGSGFSASQIVVPNFGTNYGWDYSIYLASLVDFGKTGNANAVVFGAVGTYTDWSSLLDVGSLPVLTASP